MSLLRVARGAAEPAVSTPQACREKVRALLPWLPLVGAGGVCGSGSRTCGQPEVSLHQSCPLSPGPSQTAAGGCCAPLSAPPTCI